MMVSVTICPRTGLAASAVSVTVGDLPPVWQPTQLVVLTPFLWAEACEPGPRKTTTKATTNAAMNEAKEAAREVATGGDACTDDMTGLNTAKPYPIPPPPPGPSGAGRPFRPCVRGPIAS